MSTDVKWDKDPLGNYEQALSHVANVSLEEAANEFVNHLQKILDGPRSGRVYKRGSRTHVASAPGEPPANDTGFLKSSMGHSDVTDEGKYTVSTDIVIEAEYALYLENGTKRIEPRPYILRTFEAKIEEVVDFFMKFFGVSL